MKTSAQVVSKGFTLIELLIVIALLGALAVGLLATIDPFEQLKKGRDTSLRNTVSEFYNANLRYYSTKGAFPWGTGAQAQTSLNAPTMSSVIAELVSTGELKARFMDLAGTANLGKVFITAPAADSMVVCFAPESKAFQEDPNTVYVGDGNTAVAGVCSSQTSGTGSSCFFCIQ